MLLLLLLLFYILSLTRVPVVGQEEVPSLSIISAELQLQHVGVVPHAAPLDVNGGLFLPSTRRVPGWPVHLVQSSLWKIEDQN